MRTQIYEISFFIKIFFINFRINFNELADFLVETLVLDCYLSDIGYLTKPKIMEHLQFIKCKQLDWQALQELSNTTFKTAFGDQNSEEDIANYISKAFSQDKIKAGLADSFSTFYFVQLDGITIAYFKLNIESAQSEHIEDGLEIERIYVLAAYQGIGIGQLLMNKIFELTRKMNKSNLWLGVWNQNFGAIRFYERNGFKQFSEHSFMLGKDEQTDILMQLCLKDE